MDANDIVNITRRDFLATAASGLGGLAFASLLQSNGLLAATASSSLNSQLSTLNSQPPHGASAAFRAESEAMHFPVHGRRHKPGRFVRSQTEAQRDERQKAAGLVHQKYPVCI